MIESGLESLIIDVARAKESKLSITIEENLVESLGNVTKRILNKAMRNVLEEQEED